MKRVHLFAEDGEPQTFQGLSVKKLADASVAIAKYLVNGYEGRGLGDPVFEWVTEGRRKQWQAAFDRGDEWAVKLAKVGGYSACGDMCAAVLWLLGVRDESIVNRSSDGGKVPWVVGQNLGKLRYNKVFENYDASYRGHTFTRGDVIYLTTGADHVCVAGDGDAVVTTYDYGQWKSKPDGIVLACANDRPVGASGRSIVLSGRVLVGWLPLMGLTFEESAIVPDDFDGGREDDNPYEEVSKDGKKVLRFDVNGLPTWVTS